MAILFGQEERDKATDFESSIQPAATFETEQTGLWDIAGAELSYFTRYDTSTGFLNQLTEQGVSPTDRSDILRTMYDITGNDVYKPDYTGSLYNIISGNATYSDPDSVLKELFDNEEDLKLFNEWAEANPDSSVQNPMVLRDNLNAQEEILFKAREDVLERNDSAFSKFTGQFLGAGIGSFTDPLFLASLPFGGGQASLAYRVGTQALATLVSEGVIQQIAGEGYEFYDREHNALFNIASATAFATAIPLFGRIFRKAWSNGAIKRNGTNLQIKKELDLMEEGKFGDAIEVERAKIQMENTGAVKGAQVYIHKGSEINLDGIDPAFSSRINGADNAGVISTLKSAVGPNLTNRVLSQVTKAGRSIADLSGDHIALFRAQGDDINFVKADEFIKKGFDSSKPNFFNDKANVKSDVIDDTGPVENEFTFIDKHTGDTYEVSGAGRLRRELKEIDDDLDNLDNNLDCFV